MKNRSAAISFVFVVILIDIIGIGMIIPVLPDLISEMADVDNAQSAVIGGMLTAVYSIAQLFFAPILGGVSDQYGRRPVLLLTMLGLGLDYVVIIFAPDIYWFFLARLLSGICGSSTTVASAYIADISTSENRAKNFGVIGAAFGVGFIIGPAIGGVIGQYGNKMPFVVAAVLSLVNFVYGYLVIPESLAVEHRRAFSWKRANPLGTFVSIFQYRVIIGLMACYFMLQLAAHSIQSNWAYFSIEKFDWGKNEIGWSLAMVGLMFGLTNAFLIGPVVKRWGNVKALYLGIGFTCVSYVLYSLVSHSWMMLALMVPYSVGALSGPALQSLMSVQVPKNAQGELQGGVAGTTTLAAIIGPVMMTNIFSYYSQDAAPIYFPGAPFLLSALLVVVGVALASRSLSSMKLS